MTQYSIILPAKNEAESLKTLLPELKKYHPDAEIIVVNDGSTDDTLYICEENGVNVITHPYSIGNGGAIKTGARNATGEILVFICALPFSRCIDLCHFATMDSIFSTNRYCHHSFFY